MVNTPVPEQEEVYPLFHGDFLMLATTYFANEAYHRHVRRIEEARHMEDARRNDEPPRRKSPRFRGYSLHSFVLHYWHWVQASG